MEKDKIIPTLSKTAVMQSVLSNELKSLLEKRIYNHEEFICKIEELVDKQTIDFANWFLSTRFDSSGKYLNKTDSELLEIFKRERSETVA